MKAGLLQEEQVGPLSDNEFLQLAFDGHLKLKTLVAHPTHTQGKWVQMEQIPAAREKHEEGNRYRKVQKEEEAHAKEAVRREQQVAAEAQRQAAIEQAAARRANSPITKFLLDGQSEAIVAKLYDRVCEILTQQESIEYIAVQAKPIAIAPDCVVITNRRFIIFHQKMLGQMQFEDFLWLHLHDAQIKEGVMYATIFLRSSDGRPIAIDYLPKPQARRIYRIAQEREEAAMEARRNRWIEEQRASATNIVVNSAAPAQSAPTTQAPAPTTPVAAEDSVAKLQKLKQMLDQGLIEQAEYDAVKSKILASL